MLRSLYGALAVVMALCGPAVAASGQDKSEKPIGEREPSAIDIAATPAEDLNLKKDEIPPLLIAAQEHPYSLAGLRKCSDLSREVASLDKILGDDLDIPNDKDGTHTSAGRLAQSAVGSLVPFRGLVRQVSGASAHQRKLADAILAGGARRSFLRGVGLQRGCPYPARPATPQVIAQAKARLAAEKDN